MVHSSLSFQRHQQNHSEFWGVDTFFLGSGGRWWGRGWKLEDVHLYRGGINGGLLGKMFLCVSWH